MYQDGGSLAGSGDEAEMPAQAFGAFAHTEQPQVDFVGVGLGSGIEPGC